MRAFTVIRSSLQKRLVAQAIPARSFASSTSVMAAQNNFNINSTLKMNSGFEIPVLGYGVYQTPADVAEEVVAHALHTGYRHVDSAAAYHNEAPSAAGILQHLRAKDAPLPRSAVFFTSKVPPRSMSYEGAKASVEASLREVQGLEYIDLYLLHSPYGGREGRLGAWKALVEAVEAGKVRSIGVSNYGVHHLDELEAWMRETEQKQGKGKGGVLSVNQVELHPWLARKDIVAWCQQRGVLLEAYSPLVRMTRMDDPLLKKVCERTGKTPAQVLVRWSMQKGFVPLPKSVTLKRIEENAALYDFELSDEDMKTLDTDEYSPCAWDPTVNKD